MEHPDQKEAYDVGTNLLTSEKIAEQKSNTKKTCRRIGIFFFCGIFNIILGILSIRYNYVELIMKERIRMRPGLPPLEWWRNPPINLYVSVTLFNFTNSKEFLSGEDTKLKLEEVGPIIYAETVTQKDIVWHENSTMSFSTHRSVRFLPELNEPGILNKTIITINPTVLGMAAYLHDSNFVQKFAFRMMIAEDTVFMNNSVYNILWNGTSPTLKKISNSILGLLLPRDNSGILYNTYYPKTSRYNVKIGTDNGFRNFFKINTFNGHRKIPGFDLEKRKTCPIWLENATEGGNLPPYLTKDQTIKAWREDICTTVEFKYQKEMKWKNFNAYKYVIPSNSFNRLKNASLDCHKGKPGLELPDGLIDSTVCSFDVPSALSFPHYYGGSDFWKAHLEGLKPDKEKHGSYSIIEPTTGFPLEEYARIQSNLVVPNLQGFPADVEKFSGMIIPVFWAEYSMLEFPPFMVFLAEIFVLYTPTIQIIMIVLLLSMGAGFTYFGIIYSLTFWNIDAKSPRKIVFINTNPFKAKPNQTTTNRAVNQS